MSPWGQTPLLELTADFYSGEFKVLQPQHGTPTTELDLTGFAPSVCHQTHRPRPARLLHRHKRSSNGLRGSGHGDYQTGGRHGSATVRGMIWFTQDRPSGTLFKWKKDTVLVHDFTRHREVPLHIGQHYLAPAH